MAERRMHSILGGSMIALGVAVAVVSAPGTAGGVEDRRAIPPALSAEALRAELARGRAERERLEKLNADLAAAREELRKETVRLEELIEKGRAAKAGIANSETEPPAGPGERAAGPAESAEVDSARIAALAKALKGMKAQQAGVVLSKLGDDLAARILSAMRPADAGPVLARISPERAGRLVELMARLPTEGKP